MAGTMIGIKILKRAGLNPFRGTERLKMALPKELLRDCHRDVSNNSILKLYASLELMNKVRIW